MAAIDLDDRSIQQVREGGRIRLQHEWPTNASECRALQLKLQAYIDTHHDPGTIRTIAGVDIGFEERGRTTRAAVVLFDAESLAEIDSALARMPTRMPYIPGLLSFREIPAALEALSRLSIEPDLLMVDGHGIAHPRRLGVAVHLGLVSGYPSIGVAKKRLTGVHGVVPNTKGEWTPLLDSDNVLGAVMRSRVDVKPIFISSGHRIGLESAVAWTRRTLTRFRLPAPTRAADRLASNR